MSQTQETRLRKELYAEYRGHWSTFGAQIARAIVRRDNRNPTAKVFLRRGLARHLSCEERSNRRLACETGLAKLTTEERLALGL